MNLHHDVRMHLLNLLDRPADEPRLNQALRLLSKWRSVLIRNRLLLQQGTVVMEGILEGLDFLTDSAEGCHIAKLLGCYEQPLQPYLEAAIHTGYDTVINIGCAEGYYAVGMARKMQGTRILAYDLNPKARKVCAELAKKNGVADRIEIGSMFRPEDFAACADRHILVLCDIEGAEKDLLDPAVAPALQGMDIIVESHECLVKGITRLLIERFSDSHTITTVEDSGQRRLSKAPPWFNNLAHLDQLLAVWESRSGPTPWLVMKAASRHPER